MRTSEVKRKCGIRLYILLLFVVAVTAVYGHYWMKINVPSQIKLLVGEEEQFDFSFPIEASFTDENAASVLYVNQQPLSKDDIRIDLSKPFSVSASELGEHEVVLKLFGWLPIREVSVEIIEEIEVIPGGEVIGLQIETEGVLVLGTGVVTKKDGSTAEPAKGILKSGDYIVGINGKFNITRSDLLSAIGEEPLYLTIKREGKLQHVTIQPVPDATGEYRIGTWIRTDAQGIGTITYMTTNGEFGALGHGITDVDTGLLMHISGGKLYDAEVLSVVKGKSGTPGELIGIIRQAGIGKIGEITTNCSKGIYGQLKRSVVEGEETIPIGLKQEITVGPASILCQVDSAVREYAIEIEKIELGRTNDNKGLVIRITDENLLAKTGGIVQGMSGSPIIQNGKLIGAVTHVLISDPTKGYGIFIESMLEN